MNSASAFLPPPSGERRGPLPQPVPERAAVPGAFCSYRLWVTEADGELTPQSLRLIAMVVGLDLCGQVRVSHEPSDANLAFLRACVDAGAGAPQPYLEHVVGGCSASVVYYLGQDLADQLRALQAGCCAGRRAVLAN